MPSISTVGYSSGICHYWGELRTDFTVAVSWRCCRSCCRVQNKSLVWERLLALLARVWWPATAHFCSQSLPEWGPRGIWGGTCSLYSEASNYFCTPNIFCGCKMVSREARNQLLSNCRVQKQIKWTEIEKKGKEEESLHCSSASPEVLDLLLLMGPHTWRSGDILAVEGCLYVPAHRATLI